MSRSGLFAGVLVLVWIIPGVGQLKKGADAQQQPAPQKEQSPPAVQEPAEEDESLLPKTYTFNPIEAVKNAKVGAFYWKKGKYKAAALRYLEATRWDPGMAEAWLRLGEAREKLADRTAARAAYEKYLELVPDSRDAPGLRKKLESWPAGPAKK